MQERRHLIRWQIDKKVQCRLEDEVQPTTCTLHDINFKGAKISLSKRLPTEETVKIAIVLSAEFGPIEIEMWVVWHKTIMGTNVYGLYFTRINETDKENIYKFMHRYFAHQITKQWWQGGRVELEESPPEITRKIPPKIEKMANKDKIFMKGRRRYVRWKTDRAAQIKLEGKVKEAPCVVNDINFKGARISLGDRLPAEPSLKMSLSLSEEFGSSNIEAWIVWREETAETNVYGLYFTKIKDTDKEDIYKFLRKYFPGQLNRQLWQEMKTEGGEEEMKESKVNNSKDRRIFERFNASFPLRYIDLKRNKEGMAEVKDVSAKGLGIVTKDQIVADTPLEMWLDIPDRGEPLYSRGGVVWSRITEPNKWRAGINLEKADLMGIARILRTA